MHATQSIRLDQLLSTANSMAKSAYTVPIIPIAPRIASALSPPKPPPSKPESLILLPRRVTSLTRSLPAAKHAEKNASEVTMATTVTIAPEGAPEICPRAARATLRFQPE